MRSWDGFIQKLQTIKYKLKNKHLQGRVPYSWQDRTLFSLVISKWEREESTKKRQGEQDVGTNSKKKSVHKEKEQKSMN